MLGDKLVRALERPMRENIKRLSDYSRVLYRRNIKCPFIKTYRKYTSFGILCHLFTRLLARVVSPRTIYHRLGIWPFLPIPYHQFKVWGRLDPPVSAYLKNQPKSADPDNIPWQPEGRRLSEERMGYVVEVENGIALSNGITLDRDGNTIMGASHSYISFICKRNPAHKGQKIRSFQTKLEKFGPLIIKPWSAKVKLQHLSGTVLVLSDTHHDFYTHYIFEAIGRLALVENQIDLYPTIYIRNTLPYQKRYLSMLGLDNKQIISADQDMPPSGITADRLVIPCFQRTYDYLIDSTIIGFLRRKLLPYADRSLSRGERIFVSRRKAKYRRILNEPELMPILTEYGFSVVYLEDYSVEEQISVMKFAKIVVSPHGSGLGNLLYCDPDTKVMEIFSGLNTDLIYLVAASLNLEYYYLSGEGNAVKPNKKSDTSVDPNIFKRAMAMLCR